MPISIVGPLVIDQNHITQMCPRLDQSRYVWFSGAEENASECLDSSKVTSFNGPHVAALQISSLNSTHDHKKLLGSYKNSFPLPLRD